MNASSTSMTPYDDSIKDVATLDDLCKAQNSSHNDPPSLEDDTIKSSTTNPKDFAREADILTINNKDKDFYPSETPQDHLGDQTLDSPRVQTSDQPQTNAEAQEESSFLELSPQLSSPNLIDRSTLNYYYSPTQPLPNHAD